MRSQSHDWLFKVCPLMPRFSPVCGAQKELPLGIITNAKVFNLQIKSSYQT